MGCEQLCMNNGSRTSTAREQNSKSSEADMNARKRKAQRCSKTGHQTTHLFCSDAKQCTTSFLNDALGLGRSGLDIMQNPMTMRGYTQCWCPTYGKFACLRCTELASRRPEQVIYIYICMYVCICMCIYIYIYTYLVVYLCVCICTHPST